MRISRKRYRNFSRSLVNMGQVIDDRLPPIWQAFLSDLMSQNYRDWVSCLMGQAYADFMLEVRLVRHVGGDWLAPHTDRADKVFSHIFYFNPEWEEGWGGCLEILNEDNPQAAFARVIPRLGTSVLLVRSDHSWHQVTAVTVGNTPERMSLLVHGLC